MEENKKLGQGPAFPIVEQDYTKDLDGNQVDIYNNINTGISKRFYAACAAMQGLIINFPKERMVNDGYIAITDYPELIRESYEFADELLRQENL